MFLHMRKSVFEEKLGEYGKLGSDLEKPELSPAERMKLENVLDWMIRHNAERSDTTVDAQRQVFELQSAKRDIMKRFLERLKNLDNPFHESRQPSQVPVAFVDGKYRLEDGSEITVGQLMTDGEWGLDYFPDPVSVPRRVRKRFYLEEAKRELMRRLDLQLIEHQSAKRSLHWMKKEGYQRMKEELGSVERSGLAAEKMVSNFLRKLAFDHAAPFQVIEADAYEDMEQKVDFIIKYKPTMVYRGVGVEEDPKAVGIQFTINNQPDVEEKKARQVALAREQLRPEEMLKDIVLVVLPMSDVSHKVWSWKNNKHPGGPEEGWDPETKIKVIRGVLQGIVPDEEIDRLCRLFKPDEPKPPEPAGPKPKEMSLAELREARRRRAVRPNLQPPQPPSPPGFTLRVTRRKK